VRLETSETTQTPKLDAWSDTEGILPAQLFAEVAALHDPERRLRLAVLKDAVRYFQRHLDATHRSGRVLYEDAVDWFSSPDRTEPFAFENVCEALGLDPEYVRRGLRRWGDAARARRAVNAASEPTNRPRRATGPSRHGERRAA
jgi:hypothetical protein